MSGAVTGPGNDAKARLEAMSPDERAQLQRALLARRRGTARPVEKPVLPRAEGPAVLSSPQRRLWFFDRLAPGSPVYNAVVAFWLSGPVDLDVLEEAFARVVARHEVLRSVIEVPEGADEPQQRPLDHWELHLGRHRLPAGGSTGERRDQALALARELARAPYDLAHDLTLRIDVVQVEPDEWLLVIGEHHIAFDGWSDEIMLGEVNDHYAAVLAGRPSPELPPLAVQYADYAVWQRDRLDGGALASQAAYWKRTLTGAPAVSALPLDHPRSEQQRFDGNHLDVRLGHAEPLRAFRASHGVTDFMVLVAAWAATLYRWSGETDLVLGTPMANRNRVEVEGLVGFFSNTVPLRVHVDGAAGFGALVDRVREVALEAFDHQDLPFELVVEAVSPPRVPGANPLFCVNVRVASGAQPLIELPGVEVTPVHVDLGFSRFDLAIEMQVQPEGIHGYLEFNEALLDRGTADTLLERLDTLLGAALADPDAPLWSLPQPETGSPRRGRRRGAVSAAATARTTVTARLPRPNPDASGEVALHWLDLTVPADAAGLATLSSAERDRAAAFRFDRDRDRFLRRRVLLRGLLASALDVDPAAVAYAVNDHGRPFFEGDHGLRFSASSSGEVAVVALARCELGVDVERIAPVDADREVARRLFAPEEVAALEAGPPGEFAEGFFRCWTRKEAYVKATGLGLSFPLESFAIEVHRTARPALLRSDLRPDDLTARAVRSLDVPGGGAAAALVVAHHDPRLTQSVPA